MVMSDLNILIIISKQIIIVYLIGLMMIFHLKKYNPTIF